MFSEETARNIRIAQYWGMKSFFVFCLVVVNLHIISEGFRSSRPTLFRATLDSQPSLRWLLKDSELGDVDVATVAALFLMVGVCRTWRRLAEAYLDVRSLLGVDLKKLGTITLIIGVGMIGADAYVFFHGLSAHSLWGDGEVLPCFALTVVYITLIVGASIELVILHEQISPTKPEVKS